MKALSLSEDNQLRLVELETPSPKQGEVLLAVRAAALNHREIWISKGMYPGMRLPTTLGADGAGLVTQVGPGVDKEWLGREVVCYPALDWGDDPHAPSRSYRLFGMPGPGFIAEYIVVPVANLVEKPAYLSWDEAAAIPVASLTAWRGLLRNGRIQPKQNVLITGIGGGVAQAGLAFAHALGAAVYVTSSSTEKLAFAKANGAVDGFNYRDENWPRALKEASGGIDLVFDGAPSPELDHYFAFLNTGARIVVYGSTAGQRVCVNIARFFLRHIALIGTAMGTPDEFREMIAFLETHQIKPLVHKSYPLDQAIDAFYALQSGGQLGKITIQIQSAIVES